MWPSYGLPGQGTHTQQQAVLVRDHHGALDAELAEHARLALASARDLGRMQRVQLVLVVVLLRADAFGAFEPQHQIAHRPSLIGFQ